MFRKRKRYVCKMLKSIFKRVFFYIWKNRLLSKIDCVIMITVLKYIFLQKEAFYETTTFILFERI